MDRSAHELFADAPSVSITRLRDDERITGGFHKDQGWTGIVVDLPLVRNVPVQFDEVAPAPLEAAPHDGLGNVVVALSDALGDPLDGAVGRWQPEIDNCDAVALGLPSAHARGVGPTAERRLDREALPLRDVRLHSLERDSASLLCGRSRVAGIQLSSDIIAVHEREIPSFPAQVLPRKCRLSRTIRARDD